MSESVDRNSAAGLVRRWIAPIVERFGIEYHDLEQTEMMTDDPSRPVVSLLRNKIARKRQSACLQRLAAESATRTGIAAALRGSCRRHALG